MRKLISVLLLAIVAIPSLSSFADPITVPSGLNPGDQYRLAFVTSTTRDATSSDIADYNSFVTTAANSVPALAALGTTWTAIASTSVNANDNTNTNPDLSTGVPIYNLASGLVADNNLDLWEAAHQAPIDVQENGDLLTGFVWTGTVAGGFSGGFIPLGGIFGETVSIIGISDSLNNAWIEFDADSLTNNNHFYAISGILTAAPEPSSMALACLAVAGLAMTAIRKRCRAA